MQGVTLAAFGALFAAAAAAVVFGTQRSQAARVAAPRHIGAAAAPTSISGAPLTPPDPHRKQSAADQNTPFNRMPDGGPVPPLPSWAPQSVSFGVIQFPYRGAELAPKGSPSKAQALAMAMRALPVAKKSFDKALKLGDSGSTSDAGSIPRGVLEPAVQYALFTLAKGQICKKPVDTPRGYWIVRRNE